MGPLVSVIIPTLNRPDSLQKCLESLYRQSYRNYEVIIADEEGELAKIRNEAAKEAKGEILSFIDDDVIVTEGWLIGIVECLGKSNLAGGCSGPSVIPDEYRSNRDIFRYKQIKLLYDYLFLEGKADLPGHLTKSGTWTTGAALPSCSYEGEVQFLEACNQSYKKEAFWEVGGFDEKYRGIGDWSEPDLAFRVRAAGWKLLFDPAVKLFHLPSKTGAYLKREQVGARLTNYQLFADRWVKPCFRHSAYKAFLNSYFWIKEMRWKFSRH